jgi:hypothetical protein
MNVISYINGDTTITDFPDCSAEPLAKLVQMLNDRLAGADGFLSPEDSLLVLDLGWLTVGTAGTPVPIVWRWLSELVIDPEHGIVQYASDDADGVEIRRVAELCLREAAGEKVSTCEWRSARNTAVASSSAAAVAASALVAASAAAVATSASVAASIVVTSSACAASAAAYAAVSTYATYAAYTVKAEAAFTRWAIQRWRDLAGLDNQRPDHDAINIALSRISSGA